MVRLYSMLPELRQDAHLDLATLRAIAEGGNPVVQFHVGLGMALPGPGSLEDEAKLVG